MQVDNNTNVPLPAIKVIGYDKCTGCYACAISCPEDAIKMKLSPEGFYYPYVYKDCTNCNICQYHCPIINPIKLDNFDRPRFYAGWSKDDSVRISSSSGGIFVEIARYVLEKGGVVFGASLDENLEVHHIKVDNIEDIKRLQGSKYLQSKIEDTYREAVEEGLRGRLVLFSGVPCQIAAMNSFKSAVNNNIITVGILCHGVPSYTVFKQYIDWVEKKLGKKVIDIKFRDKGSKKRPRWENYSITLVLNDGSRVTNMYRFDPFGYGYLKDLYLMEACYDCQFTDIPRFEDITLGDFWKPPIEMIKRGREGISLICTNTSQGEEIIRYLYKNNRIELKEVPYEYVIRTRNRIARGKLKKPSERETILRDISMLTFEEFKNKYLRTPSRLNRFLIICGSYFLHNYPFIRKILRHLLKTI